MPIVAGTGSSVFHARERPYEQVLEAERALRVRSTRHGLYAASQSGLYRSTDGRDWGRVDTPRDEVYSVELSPTTDRLYVGTRPAHTYASDDGGTTWTELEGFQDLPSRPTWHTPRHRDSAHVRGLVIHPDAPERLIASVEVGGVHVSDDGGARRQPLRADHPHHRVRRREPLSALPSGGGDERHLPVREYE
jgi:hypothetical protein